MMNNGNNQGSVYKASAWMLLIALVVSLFAGAGTVTRALAADLIVNPANCPPTGPDFCTIQAAVDASAAGDVIHVAAGTYAETVTVGKTLTFVFTGVVQVTGFTVTAADVTVLGPAALVGNGSVPGFLVQAGGDNFTLKDVDLSGYTNGVELAADVTSFKLIGNFIHNNSGAGLQINPNVAVGGIVTIQGNLFKDNTGNGIELLSARTLSLTAEYNSWGTWAGPTIGGGVNSPNIDYEPWTFSEVFLDMVPDTEAVTRNVVEGQAFDVALKLDAQKLYGFAFSFTYNTTLLTLTGVNFTAPWDPLSTCAQITAPAGTVSYVCNLVAPALEYSAHPGTVATFHFTANTAPLGNGPWQALFDLQSSLNATSSAAKGGVKVYVNNAGYNAPSFPARAIADANDGQIDIVGLARFTGFVDLQGRYNDSGAVVDVYNQAARTGATRLASGTSSAGGGYSTAFLAPNQLWVGSTYFLVVDRALFLPTTPLATDLADSALLVSRPLTSLGTVLLLGGDATNDDVVDVLDAGCIGSGYELPPGVCGTGGSSDVNGDGVVDILDLALMGGNFMLTSSPWTP